MQLQTRNLIIAAAVAIVTDTFLGTLHQHALSGVVVLLPGLAFGYGTYIMLSLFAGNRSVANATSQQRQAALAAAPPPGHGYVYCYRDAFIGRAIGFDLLIDSTVLAQLKSPRFTQLAVPAGSHTLTVTRQNFAGMEHVPASRPFTLAPGEIIVYKIDVLQGLRGGTLTATPDPNPSITRFATMTMVLPSATLPVPPPIPGQ